MVFLLLFVVGDAVATGELELLGLAVGVGEGVASTVFVGVGVPDATGAAIGNLSGS
jgi:hypothetical protein